ncbi:GNAT family N-acetyltransferase [Sporobolomyces salmoneus]|uniref:GNAT family N-acetyltransferase n=1 Tax=Sporobolomyces salmoneus TaxID=183962 RepID=UPI00317A9BE4
MPSNSLDTSISRPPIPSTSSPEPNSSPPSLSPSFSVQLCVTPEERERCMKIRHQVFCVEQGYDPAIEVDEKDPQSDHFLLTELKPDGSIEDVGTLRCYASPPSLLKLGRFAIHSHYRGTGAGRYLENSFISHLRTRQPSPCCEIVTKKKREVKVVAWSQCVARGFYRRCGWEEEGEVFIEEGQPHIKIMKTIELDPES